MNEKRCLAKTRSNGLCSKYRVSGKKRCSLHGGSAGSGAPKGNDNAFKHGLYTEEYLAYKREVRENSRTHKKLDKLLSSVHKHPPKYVLKALKEALNVMEANRGRLRLSAENHVKR